MACARWIVLSAVLLGGCATAASPRLDGSPSERAAVEAAVTTWFDAGLARLDTAAIGRGVTPTFLIFEDTLRLDRAGFLRFVAELPGQFGGPVSLRYTLSEWNTRVAGDVAWTSLRNRALLTVGNSAPTPLEWLETAVLVRVDGGWLIDRYQSTMVRKPGPA